MKRLYMLVCFLCLLVAPAQAASVKLAWDPLDTTLPAEEVGIWIHLGNASGLYQNSHDAGTGKPVTTEVGNLVPGTTYYLVAQAYQKQGETIVQKSEYSNEIMYAVPGLAPYPALPVIVNALNGVTITIRVEPTP